MSKKKLRYSTSMYRQQQYSTMEMLEKIKKCKAFSGAGSVALKLLVLDIS